jgi:bifunctional non-homologous end joining protein LigD
VSANVRIASATHLRRVGERGPGVEVEVGERRLRLTNLDKRMYPLGALTKGQVIDYYARAADAILPHIARRPLTLKRFPDGLDGAYFYEKQCPRHRPGWLETVPIWTERFQETYEYCTAGEPAALVWLANLANLELHAALGRSGALETPTTVVFDLDPGYPAGPLHACQAALVLRGLFEQLDLESFAKSSGSKGIHVFVPLNTAVTYPQTKRFARAVAETVAGRLPQLALAEVTRARRRGRVVIDWGQNDHHKTMVAPYSLRAVDPPTVSMPLRWEEVEAALEAEDIASLTATPQGMLERLDREGDLFAPVAELRQELPEL